MMFNFVPSQYGTVPNADTSGAGNLHATGAGLCTGAASRPLAPNRQLVYIASTIPNACPDEVPFPITVGKLCAACPALAAIPA